MRVSVIGSSRGDEDAHQVATTVGRLLGKRDHTLVCGGRGGVMAHACRGAREAGGRTIGILPGEDPGAANPHVTDPIVTGLGNARNVLVALNGDGVIAIGGRYGTLSEIGHALDAGRPVAGIGTHAVDGVMHVDSAEAAVSSVEERAEPAFPS